MLGQAWVADQLDGAKPFEVAALYRVSAIVTIDVVQVSLAQKYPFHAVILTARAPVSN